MRERGIGGRFRIGTTLCSGIVVLAGSAFAANPAVAATGPDVITTIAGGDAPGPSPGTSVALAFPDGVAASGHKIYVSDGNGFLVRKLKDNGSQVVYAGDGMPGSSGDGGPATSAQLQSPGELSVDSAGNLLVSGDNRVRVVAVHTGRYYGTSMTAGDIYTEVGTGVAGYSANGTRATSAELSGPADTVEDGSGNLVIADAGNHRIRVVAEHTGTYYGISMRAGDIYTVAGSGASSYGGDGGPARSADITVDGLAVDRSGNLLFADPNAGRIRVVAVHTGTDYGVALTKNHVYTIAGDGGFGSSGDGGPAIDSEMIQPEGVSLDHAGNIVIADTDNGRIQVVASTSGTFYGTAMAADDVYTVAGAGPSGDGGEGGPATAAQLSAPVEAAVDGSGNLVITNVNDNLVDVVAERTGTFYGSAMTAGDLYRVAGNGFANLGGDGGPATQGQLDSPSQLATDAAGNLVIADTINSCIRVVAATSGTYYGVSMTAGDIYTVAGDGTAGFAGDGEAAVSAELDDPFGVAVDAAGNLVIADSHNNRLRVVAASSGTYYGQHMTAGHIYTVAGQSSDVVLGDGGPATSAYFAPGDVAVDGAGNLVFDDAYFNRIRVVAASTGTFYNVPMTAGDIYTIAGDGTVGDTGDNGPAIGAELSSHVAALSIDPNGNVVLADTGNERIRVVAATTGTFYGIPMTAGDISTVAGNGTAGFAGDGGPATSAEFDEPYGVTFDAADNLVVSDPGNVRVRVVAASTGTSYGMAMTAGDVYTVAGTGSLGYSGDGGPATSAELAAPGPLLGYAGGFVVATGADDRIRLVHD